MTSDDVLAALQRARALEYGKDVAVERFRLVYGLYAAHLVRGDVEPLTAALKELCAVAVSVGTDAARRTATFATALAAVWRTDYEAAAGLGEFAALERHAFYPLTYGTDIVTTATAVDAWRLWMCGHADRALAASRDAIRLACEADNPMDLAMTCAHAAAVHLHRGELEDVAILAERCRELDDEYHIGFWGSLAQALGAWARTRSGALAAGRTALVYSVARYREAGAKLVLPMLEVALAETALAAECADEGLAAVERGLHGTEARLDQMFAAELWRLKGELLTLGGATDVAIDECFTRALAVSRAQGARALELRAATSLARRLRSRRQNAEAAALLGALVRQLREGWGTKDMTEAQSLLASL